MTVMSTPLPPPVNCFVLFSSSISLFPVSFQRCHTGQDWWTFGKAVLLQFSFDVSTAMSPTCQELCKVACLPPLNVLLPENNPQVLKKAFHFNDFWNYNCILKSEHTSYFGTWHHTHKADLYKLFPMHQNDTSSSPILLAYLLNFGRLSLQTYW